MFWRQSHQMPPPTVVKLLQLLSQYKKSLNGVGRQCTHPGRYIGFLASSSSMGWLDELRSEQLYTVGEFDSGAPS